MKRAFDLFAAVAGLLVASPLLLAIALAIKLDSPGPVLFRQERVGRNEKKFTLYKFRSMRHAPQTERSAPLVIDDFHTFVYSPPGRDPRVTAVGGFLRATSLDELPQLWNVLTGDMSMVGPRPELPAIVDQYPPDYHRRHAVRPGITGLAQVNGRSDLPYHQIMLHDLDYVARRSVIVDLGIVARTVVVVLAGRGAR